MSNGIAESEGFLDWLVGWLEALSGVAIVPDRPTADFGGTKLAEGRGLGD